ncbi:MAG: 23S rRNA (guanosine(2251)-2'-O)-methyltransferase RlmB [Candidatus Nanopelagicaceae bacterium]
MAGNSSRRGAVRKSRKGPSKGTGGNNKKRLSGKGPTPKAEDRPYHAAAKRKAARPKSSRSGAAKDSREKTSRSRERSNFSFHGELVAGRNAVLEALRADVPSTELIIARSIDIDDRIEESLKIALKKSLPIREVHRADVEKISMNSQGIALAIKPYQYSSLQEILQRAGHPGLIVALDGVTDPRNLGAIIRSAAAFGVSGVIIPERRSAAMTAAAWKTSAGAAARMPVAQVTNLNRAIEEVQEQGYFVVGLDGEATELISEMKVATEPIMIIVGSEGKGLSRLTSEKCDLVVKIPMRSTTESLNASVATSIALYAVDEARK